MELATDPGDCIYVDGICETCEGGLVVDNDSDDDGVCDVDEVVGCQDASACNYMELATDAGSCIYSTDLDACASCSGEQDGTGVIVDNDADNDGYCDLGSDISPEEVLGCTEHWADNYSDEATEDDSSCYRNGCMYPLMANYDSLATQDPNLSCNFNQDTLDFEVGLVTDSLTAVCIYEIDSLTTVHINEIDSLTDAHNLQVDSLNEVISGLEDSN